MHSISPITDAILGAEKIFHFITTSFVPASMSVTSSFAMFFFRKKDQRNLKSDLEAQLDEQFKELSEKHDLERQEAELMHEHELTKANFAVKVAHEVQTLLSVINSTVDDFENADKNLNDTALLLLIKRNSSMAIKLISQIAQIHKLESQNTALNLTKKDLVQFTKESTLLFSELSVQKKIKFLFETEYPSMITAFDEVILERILFNLLYHSLRYTNAGGQICLLLDLKKDEEAQSVVEIKIIYSNPEPLSGTALSSDNPYNSLPLSWLDGDDLNLSIAREQSAMLRGQITGEREDNYRFSFTVLLPLEIETDEEEINAAAAESKKAEDKVINSSITEKKPLILLVEDNDEMRTYLHDNLEESFSIIEAANGKEGWQKTLALHPNLVVSDVDMPEMNGIDLCKKIKSDKRTSHTPVILLTAIGDEYSQISGLEVGANDYIVKPFNTKILTSKIHNLLTLKDVLKKTYQKQVDIQSKEMTIESEDDKFVAKLIAVAEKNISDPNFSVEEFSRLMAMSRVTLYKKILSTTGKTPVEFTRTMRLQKAVQLLMKSKLPIAQVAYEVGYSNPNYFAKIFKEEYKMLPSQFLAAEKKTDYQV